MPLGAHLQLTVCGTAGTESSKEPTKTSDRQCNCLDGYKGVTCSEITEKFNDELEQDEGEKFRIFLYVAAPITLVAQVVTYRIALKSWDKPGAMDHPPATALQWLMAEGICSLPFKAHWWATIGGVGKLLDLMSDIGAFFINYGMLGDDSNRFYNLYEVEQGNEGDADRIRIIALVSLILGTLSWFPDAYYGFKLKRGEGGGVAARVWSAVSFLCEDLPQLVVAIIYASAVKITELPLSDGQLQMFIVSVALSAITILDRLAVIMCACGASKTGNYAI